MVDHRGSVEQFKQLSGEIWTLEVGKSKQKWKVHQVLICRDSAFFRSAVKREWNRVRPNIVSLPDDNPDVVEVYIQWLYQDKILVQRPNDTPVRTTEANMLLKCYVFGEKIQDIVFQNTVIDSILAFADEKNAAGLRTFPILSNVVYEGTPEGSPMRMLIVDMFVYHGRQGWLESHRNVDFLVDLGKKLLDLRPKPSGPSPVSIKTSSVYHKPTQ